MASKTVPVQTPYGPVNVELVACDGPECATSGQKAYMVGWIKLSPQGMEVSTMGGLPDPMDFCSLACTYKAVSLMTGN